GKTTIVDPKGTDFERYKGATIITPNLLEFTSVVGPCGDDAELVDKARNLARDLDLGGILVTRSERGMIYVPSKGEVISVPAQVQDVFDVTGAGDTVVAALAVALAAGQPLNEAILLSNLCAGVVVGKVGTSTVSIAELVAARSRKRTSAAPRTAKDQDPSEKIISVADLKAIREELRHDGRTIVMTNGCFDILHAGHVRYINAASRKGDVFAIAVNSDASVRMLKGDGRPINPLEARMEVLAALQYVDWVVSFSEPTPQNLYNEILPDILVKGADYEGKAIVGADEVIKSGGHLELIDFLDGYSTTSIIEKINRNEK
ncbi:D-glycero-beta-D-manno-heptose 1-phosphate adenylyltransferase, partial [Akkermansiaceae bacterium]|nr:D-glycero-beta-D-manno-heptose 1-phosphate adenylyltransferase [Akkermansiaceae bacterium]